MWTPEQIQKTAERITTANRRRDYNTVAMIERGIPADTRAAVDEAVRAESALYAAAVPCYGRR